MKKIVDGFEEYLIAFLICGMILFETLNALCSVLGLSVVGLPEELAIYCYIWIAFLSASFCAKKGCDVAVTMLSDKYGAGARKVLRVVNSVINLFLSGCLLVGSVGFVGQSAAAGSAGQISGIPLVIVYAASVVGYLLCTLRNLGNVVSSINAMKQQA